MKKYMIIYRDEDGDQFADFYDSWVKASDARMNATVSLGWYAALYEYTNDGYELLFD